MHQTRSRSFSIKSVNTLYTGAYGESWSPRCLLVSVDLLAALGAIRAAQRQSATNFLQILVLLKWETLESVSSCTRFSGFLTISSFGFNRLSSKLVSMFFGIVPMFVPKDFVSDCFVAQICANYGAHAHFGANLRDEAILNKIL